jgi:thiopeptide-type bacteriocin biosynthesis protein
VRFLARMAARPTPFGLFAGVSHGTLGEDTHLVLEAAPTSSRHTRLDAAYLVEVLERLLATPTQRETAAYVPNPSLYRSGERRRYVRSRPGADERRHVLVSVRDSRGLAATLEAAGAGATLPQLADALAATGHGHDRARRFVDDLVDQQLLVPTLDLQVTGADSTYGLADAVPALAAARIELSDLDVEPLGVPPDRYRGIAAGLEALTDEPRLDRLFQVDMRKQSPQATLGDDVVREILRGADLRRRLDRSEEDAGMRRFTDRFLERFEGRAVPLLEALDPDTGVAFAESAEPAPLLADLRARADDSPPATWGRREEHLLSRLLELQAAGRDEFVLQGRDLEHLERADVPPFPDAFAAMAVVAAVSDAALAAGRFRVLVPWCEGPSGARLLGRFCHADAELRAAVEEHLRAEEALDPEAVFAEIVHLPRARDVNVVARPVLRTHEIACLGRPGAPPEHQLPLDDLLLSLEDGRLVLRSRRLGRRVVPRLTTAHNFVWRGVSVYRLLCRLQGQGLDRGGSFWGPLAAAPWLPRVRSGRVVLERARWRLDAHELDLPGERDAAFGVLQDWRRSRRVPRFVCLTSDYSDLPVDLDNVLAVDGLVQALRARGSAELSELFPPPDELRARGPEGSFVHELVVPFVRSRPPDRQPGRRLQAGIRRTFPPGSEWLYARIYTGETAADGVLSGEVATLVRDLVGSGVADRWFFLRYADPELHLRVRFHGDPARLHADALPAVEAAGVSLVERGLAWRIELGTYEREVERYGGPEAIELAEQAFRADSDAVLALLPLLESGEERWRIGLCGVDRLLLDLGFDAAERRLELARAAREALARDLRWDGAVRSRIGERFRRERPELELLRRADPTRPTGLEPGLEILAERSRTLEPIGRELVRLEQEGRLTVPRSAISRALVHMHLNRLLRGDNTAQEAVIYDFLARLYEAEVRRA